MAESLTNSTLAIFSCLLDNQTIEFQQDENLKIALHEERLQATPLDNTGSMLP